MDLGDDADLEAELLALEGKSPGKKGKSSSKKAAMSMADVDKMMAGLGNIGEGDDGLDDDDDGGDDDDDVDDAELLGELQVKGSFKIEWYAIRSITSERDTIRSNTTENRGYLFIYILRMSFCALTLAFLCLLGGQTSYSSCTAQCPSSNEGPGCLMPLRLS